jgi:hypothetical protein
MTNPMLKRCSGSNFAVTSVLAGSALNLLNLVLPRWNALRIPPRFR